MTHQEARAVDAQERELSQRRSPADDLKISLAFLALVIAIALTGLSFEGNWPKVLRVTLSFAAYVTVLITPLLLSRQRNEERLPFGWFMAAGMAAGAVSGLARPAFSFNVFIAGMIGAGILFAGVHWLAIHYWRALGAAAAQRE